MRADGLYICLMHRCKAILGSNTWSNITPAGTNLILIL